MQKFRVICPHCAAGLLVTEDLLGKSGNCPGCHQEFRLPGRESFVESDLESSQESAPATPRFPEKPPEIPSFPQFETFQSEPSGSAPQKNQPVPVPVRPILRIISSWLRWIAGFQVIVGCLGLLTLIVSTLVQPGGMLSPTVLLSWIVGALGIAISAIWTLACAELILVVVSQEEMLRHILNELRSGSDRKSSP